MVRTLVYNIVDDWYGSPRLIPGNIVYADAAGQPIIVLSDVDIANEILDKKGATCSDRPVLNMAGELAGFKGWTVLLMYGPRLKESRKYMHRAIGTLESLRKFHALFDAEVRKYLKATLRDPDNIQQHIRRCLFRPFLLL
jgi:Cytochrome P450